MGNKKLKLDDGLFFDVVVDVFAGSHKRKKFSYYLAFFPPQHHPLQFFVNREPLLHLEGVYLPVYSAQLSKQMV